MVVEIVTLPTTYIAILVVLAGIGAWRWRVALRPITNQFGWLSSAAENDFGFEWVNNEIVKLTQSSAEFVRRTQTGQLNWNLVGIVGGLVLVLTILIGIR
jgi:hypothetical protein